MRQLLGQIKMTESVLNAPPILNVLQRKNVLIENVLKKKLYPLLLKLVLRKHVLMGKKAEFLVQVENVRQMEKDVKKKRVRIQLTHVVMMISKKQEKAIVQKILGVLREIRVKKHIMEPLLLLEEVLLLYRELLQQLHQMIKKDYGLL